MARRLVTPEEMARADALTIDSGTAATVLMERAGRAVARAAIRVAGGRYGKHALVICGKGNNGGDGFVAARVLANEGLTVRCRLLFDPGEAKGAALEHLKLMCRAGVEPEPYSAVDEPHWDVVVDAIFGTGFRGKAEGLAAEAIGALGHGLPVVAVDIPSGVNGMSGAIEGNAVRALVTVAIAAEKVGTAVPPGSLHAGEVETVDVGIDVSGVDAAAYLCERSDVSRWLKPRATDAHKKDSSIVVLAGSDDMSGAALLTARGAMRMGSGYVTLGTTAAVKRAATKIPELLVRAVDRDYLGPEALDEFADAIEQADALAIGPGLGRGKAQSALVQRVLEEAELPLVLDADALNALEGRTELLAKREGVTVLTPHPGELARLLGKNTKEIVADRIGAATQIAALLGPRTAVLVKGHRSIVVAAQSGSLWIVPTGGPELATAGTGDVLAGGTAALLGASAEGSIELSGSPLHEVLAAAYVHGLAGTIAGRRVGPSGVVAWDVAEALPEAVRTITTRLRS